jgi:hypothetical protein
VGDSEIHSGIHQILIEMKIVVILILRLYILTVFKLPTCRYTVTCFASFAIFVIACGTWKLSHSKFHTSLNSIIIWGSKFTMSWNLPLHSHTISNSHLSNPYVPPVDIVQPCLEHQMHLEFLSECSALRLEFLTLSVKFPALFKYVLNMLHVGDELLLDLPFPDYCTSNGGEVSHL